MTSGETRRLKLTVQYDGSDFYGWQVQPERRTVQGELQDAAERITRAPRLVTGAGRTDRGVHATGQVASVVVPVRWTAEDFRKAMNAVLPRDVRLAEVRHVPDAFHPRYHAMARTYEYRVGFSPHAGSPFHRFWCWPLDRPLDPELLGRAAGFLEGRRSFRAFAKSGQEGRGHRCRVDSARWAPWWGEAPDDPPMVRGGGEGAHPLGARFRITADRYLHHMVRYLVGTMVDVARGRRPLDDVEALLDGRSDGLVTSAPAPPEGLFLTRVEYPSEIRDLQAPSSEPSDDRALRIDQPKESEPQA